MELIWDISNNCNLKCKYCAATSIDQIKNCHIDYNAVLNNIEGIVDEVSLMGGEPLLVNGITNVLSLLTQKKIKINIITNGQVNPQVLDAFIKKGILLQNITVSIDGLLEDNDFYRGKGSSLKAIEFIKRLLELNRRYSFCKTIGTSIVLHKNNYNTVVDFVDYLFNKIGIDQVVINPVMIGENCDEEIKASPQNELDSLINIAKYAVKNNIEKRVNITIPTPLVAEYINLEARSHYNIKPKGCNALSKTIYCDPYGNVGACRYSDKPLNVSFSELSPNDQAFDDFKKKRKMISSKNCDCIYKDICNSCAFAKGNTLGKNPLCKEIERRYDISNNKMMHKFVLSSPSKLNFNENEYMVFFPEENIKQTLTREGYDIYKAIENSSKTAFEIGEYSGVIYTANPDVETADSGKTETDIPA